MSAKYEREISANKDERKKVGSFVNLLRESCKYTIYFIRRVTLLYPVPLA